MKYSDCPSGFRVKHWRHLYDACISTPEALKKIADNSTFVVFDAEPWGGDTTKAAEIGISLLRMPGSWKKSIPPKTLSGFVNAFAVETHRIHMIGLERTKKCEPHCFGQEHYVPSIGAEKYIINLIDSCRQKYSITEGTTEKPQHVVFVGFDLQFEFRLLSTIYNGLTHYFTSWLDLQELARIASCLDKPGLSETLKACGFGYQDPKDLHTLNGRHNAATDTVRAAAILQHFLARLDSDLQLDIAASVRNASTLARRRRALPANAPDERKFWNGARPKPRELYPYTARVRRSTGDVLTPRGLCEAFEEYNPVAVGTAKQHTNRYGWVCLADLSSLEEFIRQVDGSQHKKGGTWIVVSDFDPEIVPARNMHELKERLHAKADEKREERRLKRLANEAATVQCVVGSGL